MQAVIYDVAVSIDGFISGPDEDISCFPENQQVIEDYYARLSTYACAIMGRNTYEFGYRFGMQPGENPYPAMDTYVFSASIDVPDNSDISVVRKAAVEHVLQLKSSEKGPLYLCGGGLFAAALLAAGAVDRLRLKRAPVLLGAGTRLFAGEVDPPVLCLENQKHYDGGYLFQQYAVQC